MGEKNRRKEVIGSDERRKISGKMDAAEIAGLRSSIEKGLSFRLSA